MAVPMVPRALLSKLREIRVLTLPPEHAACLPPTGVGATQVREALAYTEVADALALALLEVDPVSWPASSALRLILRSVRERQPIGRNLLDITP